MVITITLSELCANVIEEISAFNMKGSSCYGLKNVLNVLQSKNIAAIRQIFADGGTRFMVGDLYSKDLQEIRVVDDCSERKEVMMILCERDFW